jgi:hypothetical protein
MSLYEAFQGVPFIPNGGSRPKVWKDWQRALSKKIEENSAISLRANKRRELELKLKGLAPESVEAKVLQNELRALADDAPVVKKRVRKKVTAP